ncbi:putative 1-acyl-sn-glycerol-3-phosphate acyltransferase 5 [Citrus sinensis]|uniref:1-acyl-sn-glycerol-3-phosphate acyltransferase 5 n=1 Tax=Citrus sinensis TaxID=2711 RepID=A0ACB8KQR2_CITSI|nr:putative 1-acyl-sn-glycerol-3-phosphate acyltransferase 5 [Citrus sinensis]
MDVKSALIAKDVKKHRSLTPVRVFRGLICLLVLLSTAFTMIIYCGFPSAIVLRLLSIHYSRKLASFFFVVFCGETVPAKERVLLIANHRTEVDWMYLWDFALPKGCHGYIKYILKSSLMKILYLVGDFTFWSSFQWRESGRLMNQTCTKCFQLLKIPKTPSGLLFSLKAPISRNFFFHEQKCIRSQKYAAENGLPILKNVLLPQTKGFCACLEDLRGSLDAENLCTSIDSIIDHVIQTQKITLKKMLTVRFNFMASSFLNLTT